MAAVTAKPSSTTGPQWSDNDIYTKLWRYVHFSPAEKQQTRQKVQAVSNYLFSLDLFLKGAPADGNCFFHSFLKSYVEKTKKNELLEQKNNKIKYLRTMVAEQVRNTNQERAKTIKKDRTWISSDEGVKIALLLGFPIRVITAHLAENEVVIEDLVHKVDGTFQQWELNSPKPSLQETPMIVDLGGHFIWASPTPPPTNLPQLSTKKLTVWSKGSPNDFHLDGTEENFRAALKGIAQLHGVDFKEESSLDDSYESDEDFTKEQDGYKPYVWKDNSPPPASKTTISCIDGNVKGNEILTQCRKYISEFLNHMRSEDLEDNENAELCPGRYFAIQAGKFAKYKTNLDANQQFSPGEYSFGESQVKLLLNEKERLFIVDEDLKNWITKDLGLNITRWDLPYRGYGDVVGIKEIIEAIKNNVLSYTGLKPRKVPDNELGTAQLYCAFPLSYPIGNGPYLALLRQGALHKFLDFFNALIFGVEASRNNLVFLTGLLVLLDMRYGSFPTEEGQKGAYLYDDLFDLFPMAVIGTGAGNFVAEKAMYIATEQLEKNKNLLAGRRSLGFSSFRENPTWLKVALKSEILIYNWLANRGVIECAAREPLSSSVESIKILETDDWETMNRKREHNEQVLKTLEYNIDERLYEEILHHYEKE